jgi:hypothetical protein
VGLASTTPAHLQTAWLSQSTGLRPLIRTLLIKEDFSFCGAVRLYCDEEGRIAATRRLAPAEGLSAGWPVAGVIPAARCVLCRFRGPLTVNGWPVPVNPRLNPSVRKSLSRRRIVLLTTCVNQL